MYDNNRNNLRRNSSSTEGTRRNYAPKDYSRYGTGLSGSGEYGRNEYRSGDYNRNSSSRYSRGGNYPAQTSGYAHRPQRYNPLAPKKNDPKARAPRAVCPDSKNEYYRMNGVLEMHPNGFGFLRDPKDNFVRHLSDPFVACGVIERLGLREGAGVEADVRPARGNTGPRVCAVYNVDGIDPADYAPTPQFDDLVPVTPHEMYRLEITPYASERLTVPKPLSTRIMDILTPLGKGQRALIVAPPRSGKTYLLKDISQSIIRNNPDVYVIVLLIDERPEEVTDFKKFVGDELNKYSAVYGKARAATADVFASSLDCELESHIRLAQFVTKRCKRLAEMGKDVFLLLDSITRLARAYNKWGGNTGRTMTGGLDIKAMDLPKKIFSTARQIDGYEDEKGNYVKRSGSLTIVGTALVETGSRMDDLIFQEFKGTGNMELVLDRRLADRRIWPAIDVTQSGTRHEEKLLNPAELKAANLIRRTLVSSRDPVEAMERLSGALSRFETNSEFFQQFMQRLN